MDRKILRIIDANYNRAKEALRVIEDIARFLWSDKKITRKIKSLRHSLTIPFKNKILFRKMILERDSKKDVGKSVDEHELKRKKINDILYANFQRAKESMRVLEEIFKIIDKKSVYKLKNIRYNLYSLEKSAQKRLTLHNN